MILHEINENLKRIASALEQQNGIKSPVDDSKFTIEELESTEETIHEEETQPQLDQIKNKMSENKNKSFWAEEALDIDELEMLESQ
jgi:hypothetical protein